MFRGLVLAILVMMAPHTDAAQLRGVLHITVALVDGNQQVTPVPRYALLISDNPPSAIPRRVLTSLEGVPKTPKPLKNEILTTISLILLFIY